VELTGAAPVNGTMVALASSSSRVQVPSSVLIPAGAQSATFEATVLASDRDEQPQITASLPGAVRIASPTIVGIRPTALTCSAQAVGAGAWLGCAVDLNSPNVPEVARLALSSSDSDLLLPATIITRPGQTELTFNVYANPLARQATSTITVQLGGTSVAKAVTVTPARSPILTLPHNVNAIFGQQISATFSAVDPNGLRVLSSASGLPEGATFDPETGAFLWTPTQSQQGAYSIELTATNSASASSTGAFEIVVDSGTPIITNVQNAASGSDAACSPGSVASVAGRWFASSSAPVADPAASSTQLNGAQVKVDNAYAFLVDASAERIDFICPAAGTGPRLTVSVEDQAGATPPVSVTMLQGTPGIYSVDGSGAGQGMITLAGTSLLAATRSYLGLGQPAEPGDSVTIRATGLGTQGGAWPTVKIGDFTAQSLSVQPAPEAAGVYDITVVVPFGVQTGDAVPVVISYPAEPMEPRAPTLTVQTPGGLPSNSVTMAIEPATP